LAFGPLQALAQGDDSSRVLSIKSRISSKEKVIRVKDIASNYQILSDAERELEVAETPVAADETITIIDLAYMLQRHSELMDLRLKGPRNIVLQKASDSAAVEKAKSEIVSQIKALAPWKDWDIDVMLSSSDENSISRPGPSTGRSPAFREQDHDGPRQPECRFHRRRRRTSSKCALNPTILRKVEVVVLNANCRQGQILSETMLKRVPMWLGPEGKDCMTDYNACVGRELARTMSTGDIVKANDILNPVCAKRGDMIWVECRDHGLSVKLAVTAMESGRQGDLIKVVNQPTQRTFLVLLVGERQALYKMGS
jgi:flagella basal body P-ring formation protein FlgA